MKKKRINLSEKYPRYFAATGRTENFAELTDEDSELIQKLEDKLTKLEELEAKEGEEEEESASEEEDENNAMENEEEESASEEEDDNQAASITPQAFAALQAKVSDLEKTLKKTPGAMATVIDTDASQEGGGKKKVQAKNYATSVDKELDGYFK